MIALKPSMVYKFIHNAIKCKEIPYVSGPPGIGKSDIYHQIADDFGLLELDVRLSNKLPEDLTGLPFIDPTTKKATYLPFDTFPFENDDIPNGYNGWMILLDELSSASEEVMAAIYELLLGHKVGGKKLHPRAIIVAAGNRETDSAIARALPDTLITRMLCCEMEVSYKDWIKWAKKINSNSNTAIIDFIEKYPDMLLSNIPHENREELEPYNTPRGWSKMFKILNLHENTKYKSKITRKDAAGILINNTNIEPNSIITKDILNLMNAAVGTIAATSFKEHYNETIQIPYPWDIAQSPRSTKVPSSVVARSKLVEDIAEHFIDTQEQSRDALIRYMNRMENEDRALFIAIISNKLGTTISDIAMIDNIKERLVIEDINKPDKTKGTM